MVAQSFYRKGATLGGKARNVVLVSAAYNCIYAFDAGTTIDTTPLWKAILGPNPQIETNSPETTNLGPD